MHIRHKTTQALLSYFNWVRGSEAAPLRSAIDPSRLKAELPDIFILEKAADGPVRFRLAGTRVCTVLGQEVRGEEFTRYWRADDRHRIRISLDTVMATRVPLLIDVKGASLEDDGADYEMLLLPMRSNAIAYDRILGSLSAISNPHATDTYSRRLQARSMFLLHYTIEDRATAEDIGSGLASLVGNRKMADCGPRLTLLQGGRRD